MNKASIAVYKLCGLTYWGQNCTLNLTKSIKK